MNNMNYLKLSCSKLTGLLGMPVTSILYSQNFNALLLPIMFTVTVTNVVLHFFVKLSLVYYVYTLYHFN